MKKNRIWLSLLVLLTAVAAATIAACTFPEEGHTHTYADAWSQNETHHWHAATCGHADAIADPAAHEWVDRITKEPTCTEEGSKFSTCTVCGYELSSAIPMAEHTFDHRGRAKSHLHRKGVGCL